LSSLLGADDLEPRAQADILPKKRTLWPLIPHHIAPELLSNVSTHGQSFCLPFGNDHDPPTRQQVKAAVKQRISFCICPEEKSIVIWWGQEVHCRPRHHAKLGNCLAFDELTGQQSLQSQPIEAIPSVSALSLASHPFPSGKPIDPLHFCLRSERRFGVVRNHQSNFQ
jgi:hypothetical protein